MNKKAITIEYVNRDSARGLVEPDDCYHVSYHKAKCGTGCKELIKTWWRSS
jgi:hypothetical protein